MELMNERHQVRDVADRHLRAYPDPRFVYANKTTAGDMQAKLRALDPEEATAEDVAAIVGNRSWVEQKECNECGAAGWDTVQLGDPERETVCICAACLKAAVRLVKHA